MIKTPLSQLQSSRLLESPEQVAQFDAALAQLPPILTSAMVEQLVSVLDDSTRDTEVMFGLLHRIENTELGVEESVVARSLPDFVRRSPWWAEVTVMRLLNNAASLPLLVDHARAIPESLEALRSLLGKIGQGTDHVARLAQEAKDRLVDSTGGSGSEPPLTDI